MLYRLAFALGLLFLGIYIGREVSRTRPVRLRLVRSRPSPTRRLTAAPVGKTSLH